MPIADIYLPDDVYARLRDASRALRLPQKAFMRAILIAAVTELERADGVVLPAGPERKPTPPAKARAASAPEGGAP